MTSPKPLDLATPAQLLGDEVTAHYFSRINEVLSGNEAQTSLADDGVTASVGYVQAELQAVMDKLDEILLALQGG